MARGKPDAIVVVGAGAAGLMAGRELARAGRRVTILEARDRCGGRIDPLPAAEFGYPADAGAEFIHGEAPIIHGLLREAGLTTRPLQGMRWHVKNGVFSQGEPADPHDERLHQALAQLTADMTVAEFLDRHFAAPEDAKLRWSIERMVEGYDAADPRRASIQGVREEWMEGGRGPQARIVGGYGALVAHLVAQCRQHGVTIRLGAAVTAIAATEAGAVVRCADSDAHPCDGVILTVPLPLLREIDLPPPERDKAAAASAIGYGNVVKILLRFKTPWWRERRHELADLGFLITDARIPVWWTQNPADVPVLTGWFGGPRTQALAPCSEQDMIGAGLASLAGIFGREAQELRQQLVAARAINWGDDPFARGAYSYATVETRDAQAALVRPDGRPILFSGEAFYSGREIGTVEAALASGLASAGRILKVDGATTP